MTMNTEDRSKLRKALAAYLDEAPPAPEWGDWETLVVVPTRPPTRRPRGLWVAAAAALIVVVAFGGAAFIARTPGTDAAGQDPLAHQPGEYPHLLIDLPGWELTQVHQRPTEVEYDYGSESAEATLTIEVGDQSMLDDLVADRVASASDTSNTSVFGRSATMIRYADAPEWSVIWIADDLIYELRAGPFDSSTEMRRTADALSPADHDEWLAALSGDVVTPENQGNVVAEMMLDIPLPAGFDPDRMRYDSGIEILGFRLFLDRYQLGAHVSGAATCAWIEQWVQAKATADTEALNEAVAAMATSTEWAILLEMNPDGDYPEVVWEIAAAMASGGQIYPDEPELGAWTIENWSNRALGCDDKYPAATE